MRTCLRNVMGICVLVVMVNLPQASHAQFDGGGGGIVVFDPSNFAKNSITAAQMLKQVANSTQEVALLLRNLIATGGAWEDTAQLLRLLNEVPATGEALHYQLPDLDQQMQQRFPGYIVPSLWVTSYQRWTDTSLDTLRGTLDTVHEQLRPEQQTREDALLAVLQAKSDGAAGNLDVTQAGNMLIGQVIEEQRKLRQLMGALINAHNVTAAREINEHAAAERIMQEWFAKGAEVEIKPLTGEGGFGRLGPTR